MITFEEWWEKYDPGATMTPESIARAAFNAGRTEGRPRVWRYKKVGGAWKIEFLEIGNESSSSSK